tara:strand:- start:546 stop:764 length:219 start_codon:yes stop_codon:yes gene_type:complete
MNIALAVVVLYSTLLGLGFALGVVHSNEETGELTGRTFKQMYEDRKQCEAKLLLNSESCIFVITLKVVDNVK